MGDTKQKSFVVQHIKPQPPYLLLIFLWDLFFTIFVIAKKVAK